MDSHSAEEQVAASAVVALRISNDTHNVTDDPDFAAGLSQRKKTAVTKSTETHNKSQEIAVVAPKPPAAPRKKGIERSCLPYPFYYYKDVASETDPDPFTPLTFPGRVPNFPAKLHAILSRPDLADVVCWMPHGRSWRVLKPREFEVLVVPKYFDHAKFSSFIRQANGWGFRRITQGADRNSYYHERFLRGLPHLCKKMRRPGVTEKKAANADHEPDLYKISKLHPVPAKADEASIQVDCNLKDGPKARMPILSSYIRGASSQNVSSNQMKEANTAASAVRPSVQGLSPADHLKLDAFHRSIVSSEKQFGSGPVSPLQVPSMSLALPARTVPGLVGSSLVSPLGVSVHSQKLSPLASANHLALMAPQPQMPAAAMNGSAAASQFVAGFAAATIFNQRTLQQIIDSLSVGQGQSG